MVRDLKTQDLLRADHMLKEGLAKIAEDPKSTPAQREEALLVTDQIDDLDLKMLGEALKKFNIKSPLGNDLG